MFPGVGKPRPFGEELLDLMDSFGYTYRTLAARTLRPYADRRGKTRLKPYEHSYLQQLAKGKRNPSREAIEVIAEALGVSPQTFSAYLVYDAADAARAAEADVGLDLVVSVLNMLRMNPEAFRKAMKAMERRERREREKRER